MKDKIEIVHRDHTCGDGCCYENWIDIEINGVPVITRINPAGYEEPVKAILSHYKIEAEVEEVYAFEDPEFL